MEFEVIIGLEVHAQLLTRSKAYSTDSTEYGGLPNLHLSPVTLGLPGTLPVVNKAVIEAAIKMGIACHSKINRYNVYDRKNYFYPDLPKGYQITQDKTPICMGGFVEIDDIDGKTKKIELTRIHMEEDSGKSLHIDGEDESFVDFNRAGVALIEIVTEPCLRNSKDAGKYLMEIRRLVRYLGICDGNMEEGSLRCDANVSLRPKGTEIFNKKVEVKNMNSFRNVQNALEYEIERQYEVYKNGGTITQSETRNFDPVSGKTIPMRLKEELNDYRFFPDPDLPPVILTDDWIEKVKSSMPALPRELLKKFVEQFDLPDYDARVLTENKAVALYFDRLCELTKNYKQASNWVMGPVKSYLNELTRTIEDFPISEKKLAQLIDLVAEGKVSNSVAEQKIFPEMLLDSKQSPEEIASRKNLILEENSEDLKIIIQQVLESMPEKVEEYKNGKKGLQGLFMGRIMKEMKGRANPREASKLLSEELEK